MKNRLLFILLFFLLSSNVIGQNYPWERPLNLAWSSDGITFGSSFVFQDSSGVPSVIRWKGDTLICAFQWFRQPIGSFSWDKVAVKFSYDNGLSWTEPEPIVVNGLPAGYQRPFDPALALFSGDSIRIYYSSSVTMPAVGQDSIINTYSAKSNDGIHFEFEPGARVDVLTSRVIDPSVIYFNHSFHYIAPVGSPAQGAYHFVSLDGIIFSAVPDIPSDSAHNWAGNYMVEDSNELRFYGGGHNYLWYNSTPNGGQWNGYISTNVPGGDPSVVKISTGNYLMIYTGNPYPVFVKEEIIMSKVIVSPNPAIAQIQISGISISIENKEYTIHDASGNAICFGRFDSENTILDISELPIGYYFIQVKNSSGDIVLKFIKV